MYKVKDNNIFKINDNPLVQGSENSNTPIGAYRKAKKKKKKKKSKIQILVSSWSVCISQDLKNQKLACFVLYLKIIDTFCKIIYSNLTKELKNSIKI